MHRHAAEEQAPGCPCCTEITLLQTGSSMIGQEVGIHSGWLEASVNIQNCI